MERSLNLSIRLLIKTKRVKGEEKELWSEMEDRPGHYLWWLVICQTSISVELIVGFIQLLWEWVQVFSPS